MSEEMPEEEVPEIDEQFLVERLSKDLRKAAERMSSRELRFLVGDYYSIQKFRVAMNNQIAAAKKADTPMEVLAYLHKQAMSLEGQVRAALKRYTDNRVECRWAKSILGIADVLSAGSLAWFDIEQAPTVGHFWRLGGLDPTSKWIGKEGAAEVVKNLPTKVTLEQVQEIEKRLGNRRIVRFLKAQEDGRFKRDELETLLAKRPWNRVLKTVLWKIGNSFSRCHHPGNAEAIARPEGLYVRLYVERKKLEVERNDAGRNEDEAARTLASKRWSDTDTRKCYQAGKLPPGRLQLRAQRYAVKIFLSHLHEVMYFCRYRKLPPNPFVLEHGGHSHRIEVPNMELVPGLAEAWAEYRKGGTR